ncbi:MAG: hypothetical protein A2Z17_03520 [Gammaproteobacteria bacterium RBG_16_66_13]|nr:MAG: hypothetical protein A2Z17_03520 [Gammaproteobacteria bacterium RBG_16_66_13]
MSMDVENPNGSVPAGMSDASRRTILIAAAAILLLLVAGGAALVLALVQNPAQAETWRDVVIIIMGLESLLLGVALIILMVQVARLTALLQDEIRPMLQSTNNTLDTLRGTTRFLSDNLVSPVIRANGAAAALRRVLDLVRGGRVR